MKLCASISKQEGTELEAFLVGDPAAGAHEGHEGH